MLKPYKVVVLRLNHRPSRDSRVTSHVALVARAFGADEIVVADVWDKKLETTVEKVNRRWGGGFAVKSGVAWRGFVVEWARKGGEIVHLTMYGEPLPRVLPQISQSSRDKLIVVGGAKVPAEMYSLAHYNVRVTRQPHSEVAALAVFLDRLFEGRALSPDFEGDAGPSAHAPMMKAQAH